MNEEQFRELLAQDRLDELIVLLRKQAPEEFADALTTIEARFHKYEQDRNAGVASREELNVEIARIRQALLSLVHRSVNYQAEQKKGTPAKRRVALGAFLTVWFLSAGLLFIPLQDVPFSMEAEVDYIRFKVEEDWDLSQPVYLSQFEGRRLSRMNEDVFTERENPIDCITLDRGDIQLYKLPLKKGYKISLEKNEGREVILAITNNSLNATFNLEGVGLYVRQIELDTLVGTDASRFTAECYFDFNPQLNFFLRDSSPSFNFTNIKVDSLNFTQKEETGKDKVISTINNGSVTVGTYTDSLSSGEFLSLNGLSETYLTLSSQGDALKINLKGKATSIRTADLGAQSVSLKPNWLTYLAREHKIAFYSGILLWLTGLVWFFRKVVPPRVTFRFLI